MSIPLGLLHKDVVILFVLLHSSYYHYQYYHHNYYYYYYYYYHCYNHYCYYNINKESLLQNLN